MVICPQCSIQHGEGDEFCGKCGSFLLAIEDPPSEEERANVKLYCPKCQLLYKKGNYCMRCGSLLMQGIPSKETGAQRLEKKSTKRLSKEWLRLLKEEKALESRVRKLETQREKISSDVLDPLFIRYKERLESLSPLHQEVETELESIRKRASGEMAFLEDELKPIQKRLGEFQSLYKLGAVIKPDFVREKKGLKKEIKSREKSLKKYRQILSLLPAKMGGRTVSPGLAGDLLQPIPLLIIGIIIPLMVGGGYFLWPQHTESGKLVLKEIVVSPSTPSSSNHPPAVMEDKDSEKIGSIFENIRQANLQKNIDLFMSCFSFDFNGTETKRLNTLKMWENYNYLDLSYDLKKQTISGDTADVRLEWLVRTSQKTSGQQKDGRTVLDVTLKREDGRWKIIDIKPVS
jgi:DNA-directed RNA polymerase subunit M/transcription elongation factor TFIIS